MAITQLMPTTLPGPVRPIAAKAPAVTSLVFVERGVVLRVAAVTAIDGLDEARYHWFLDGRYVATTRRPVWGGHVRSSERFSLHLRPTTDAAFDHAAHALTLEQVSGVRTLEWLPSTDSDVASYRVEQATGQSTPGANDWTSVATLPHDGRGRYRFVTEPLTDVTWYWHRVVPVGDNGEDGTAVGVGAAVFVVRVPAVPAQDTTFDDGTQRITFTG